MTLVALHTPNTTYALRLEESVRPVYWGARRPEDDLGPAGEHAEDFPVASGCMFGAAALSAADGPLRLRVAGHEWRDDELVVRLAGDCEVDLHYRVFGDSDVIERWSVVRHTGRDLLLTDHAAAVWCLPVRADYRLSHVTGGWARENGLYRTPVPVAETTLISRRGVTGHATNPWVMLDDGTATEDSGEVWSAALAFSGSWRITVSRTAAGRCAVLGAAGHDRSAVRLAEGDELTSPVFAGLCTTEGFGGASRHWHSYQQKHVLPQAEEIRPVFYQAGQVTDGQRELAERAAKLGVELFVVDDAVPSRLPDGLRPLADHVRSLGMAFGLRVEVRPAGARAFDRLDALIRETGLAFLEWDCHRTLAEDGPSARIGHRAGVDEVLDRLRVAHPGVRVEARTGQAPTGDAMDRLTIQRGYTQVYPPGTMVAWVTDSPNPITGRAVPLRFRFQVAMAGVLGLGGDLTRWTAAELDEATDLIATYRDIRPVVQHGTLYRLASWIWQYQRGDRTVLLAWHVTGAEVHTFVRLRGLDPARTYRDNAGRTFDGATLLGDGLPVAFAAGEPAGLLVCLTAQRQDAPSTVQEDGLTAPPSCSK
ncbi:alpha-galactosidase [Paractinoplanes rishiriensis]|uniref:alpha-galactosidase n=1 Tax=Paractinoplanes rishiriensis TaxID=1050105 RepID=A0A919N0G5_9ACTN|nr:glycoside hydrolase family 36 N-terminal domain-containing protein [Actinoplanes rishiriensis]GIE99590.1 alpha-galactosidase [Actinoplanes rishiriensis]